MKASLLFFAVAIVATVASSSSAATWRPPARESISAVSGTMKQLLTTTVVPLRVQRLLKAARTAGRLRTDPSSLRLQVLQTREPPARGI